MSVFVKRSWAAYGRNRLGVFGLAVLGGFVFVAVFAPLLAQYPPLQTSVAAAFLPPSIEHPFGTDDLGRDLLSEMIYGARVTLLISFLAVVTSTIVGVGLGAVAGYYGGVIDAVLMRVTEMFLVVPPIFLALVFVALFGTSIWNIVAVIALLSWPQMARLVRADFLSLRERPFAKAARTTGCGDFHIIFGELLPNAMPTIIVNMSLTQATAILIESALSFLGFGDPTQVSWGLMLNNAQQFFRQSWYMAFFPGLAIFFVVLSLNLIGEGLNDMLNPRRKQ